MQAYPVIGGNQIRSTTELSDFEAKNILVSGNRLVVLGTRTTQRRRLLALPTIGSSSDGSPFLHETIIVIFNMEDK